VSPVLGFVAPPPACATKGNMHFPQYKHPNRRRARCTRRWKDWLQPPDPEEHLDYYETVTRPMDLSTMLSKVHAH